jgi:hypothetical protein
MNLFSQPAHRGPARLAYSSSSTSYILSKWVVSCASHFSVLLRLCPLWRPVPSPRKTQLDRPVQPGLKARQARKGRLELQGPSALKVLPVHRVPLDPPVLKENKGVQATKAMLDQRGLRDLKALQAPRTCWRSGIRITPD